MDFVDDEFWWIVTILEPYYISRQKAPFFLSFEERVMFRGKLQPFNIIVYQWAYSLFFLRSLTVNNLLLMDSSVYIM